MCDRRLVDSGYTREYPAASQYVTAVGGTALSRASNARGWTESVWSTNSTEGDLCTAGVGYDGPTGLGTPNGAAAFGPASTGSSDFSVSVNPTNVSVAAGSNATATVSTAVTSGSSDSVALSASGLPSRVTASFNPSTVNSGSSSTVTFAASSSAAAGNDSVTITGIGSHTATLTLSVTSGGGGGTCAAAQTITNPGFESGTAGWGSTAGVIGQYGSSGQPTHSGTWDAWLDGYGRDTCSTRSTSPAWPARRSRSPSKAWRTARSRRRSSSTTRR